MGAAGLRSRRTPSRRDFGTSIGPQGLLELWFLASSDLHHIHCPTLQAWGERHPGVIQLHELPQYRKNASSANRAQPSPCRSNQSLEYGLSEHKTRAMEADNIYRCSVGASPSTWRLLEVCGRAKKRGPGHETCENSLSTQVWERHLATYGGTDITCPVSGPEISSMRSWRIRERAMLDSTECTRRL
jgi:hypothetical protein